MPVYESSSSRQQYTPQLRRVLRLAEAAAKRLREMRRPLVPDRILLAFLGKSIDGLRGVLILQKSGLCHEAQSLARTLFEVRLSFDAFVEMMRADVRTACMRVMDAVMLEKVKQARASEFKGLDLIPGAPTPAELLEAETQISSRYSPSELKKLKQYGFTGMNIEQRAIRSGLSDKYNIVYRNFSRNVHSTDFIELFLQEEPSLIGLDPGVYVEYRDAACCDVAFISVAGIAIGVNHLASLGLDRRIQGLLRAQRRLRHGAGSGGT